MDEFQGDPQQGYEKPEWLTEELAQVFMQNGIELVTFIPQLKTVVVYVPAGTDEQVKNEIQGMVPDRIKFITTLSKEVYGTICDLTVPRGMALTRVKFEKNDECSLFFNCMYDETVKAVLNDLVLWKDIHGILSMEDHVNNYVVYLNDTYIFSKKIEHSGTFRKTVAKPLTQEDVNSVVNELQNSTDSADFLRKLGLIV